MKKLFSKENPRMKKFKGEFKRLIDLEQKTVKRFSLEAKDFYPCLNDATASTGFDRHYVYHPAWAARIIKTNNPEKHIDISSTLYFCSMLSAFVPVEFYDYRPAKLFLTNLKAMPGDLMNLPFADASVTSLSCMHTIEHIGLARYGDPLDYNGDIKAISELKRVLAKDGSLLFVVPIGNVNKIFFNAHRVYTKESILALFSDLSLQEFVLIPEDEADGGLVVNPDETLLSKQVYGCGCFWFKKQ